ncbi:molecular chaperone [Pseudocitrobacter corydidari]|uniref:Chaperone protein PapD n=1 Tax=Pseudocitrobacter corydidari TaxID=2891570 RepID=A0ABY3S9U5_9ENTR|nr:molecular chaperone [Pseudocitrobacter corydidari]UGS43486.1 Chaperone protein PapD [Pseudocitrobacter corydidari]
MTLSKTLYILTLLIPLAAHSAIQPDRTRIVFNSADKASSLRLENQSKKLPYLAYSWIENEQGQKDDRYFSALPPIQRLEPGTLTQVRIVKQASVKSLPADRESLFYFNVREIPPEPENSGNIAVVQLAVQSRLKLFWRPEALKKTPGVIVEEQLTASQHASTLRVQNPTGYYITLAFFGKDDRSLFPGFKSTIIAPFSAVTLDAGNYTGNTYALGYMDDYGAMRTLNVRCHGQCDVKAPEKKK